MARKSPWILPFKFASLLIVGQKRPLLPRQVWSIRVRLEMSGSPRDLALFNLSIDSKLRASDLIRLKMADVCSGALVRDRRVVMQQKTGRPVQFEITEVTRQSVERLLASQPSDEGGYVFRSRFHGQPHISSRQYARIAHRWIRNIGLDDRGLGTHSLRRTKVAQLYRKTGTLRAVQFLLGHAKMETTVRYGFFRPSFFELKAVDNLDIKLSRHRQTAEVYQCLKLITQSFRVAIDLAARACVVSVPIL